jgi:transposase
MKAHAQHTARLQLIAHMLEGQSWQQAMTTADLSIGRSTAYRLVQQARDPERSEQPFLDDRHGHPYKLTGSIRSWIVEYCTQHPGVYASQVKTELQAQFGLQVSRGHMNRVRAEAGVTAPWRGRVQKKNRAPASMARGDWEPLAAGGSPPDRAAR